MSISEVSRGSSSIVEQNRPRGSSGAKPGSELTYRYQNKGKLYATEMAKLEPSVDFAKSSLQKTIAYLKDTKGQLTQSGKIKEIDKLISIYTNLLEGKGNLEKGWITSNFFRSTLREAVATGNAGDIAKVFEKTFVSGLVNFRYHSCEMENAETVGFYRFGVITDPRNGFTSLKELQYFKTKGSDRKALVAYSNKLAHLKNLLQDPEKEKNLNVAQKASLRHAIKELENLDKTVVSRQAVLSSQMLHLVTAQVSKNLSKIKDTDTDFSLVHLGLLNPKSEGLDKTGWKKHEGNQIKDMEAIFEIFKGKKLIFDGKGPLIDEEGNIHLEEDMSVEGEPRELVLKPILANISVQGYTKNKGMQAELNATAMREIKHKIDDMPADNSKREKALALFQTVQERLDREVSDYTLAEDFSRLALLADIPLSMGCLSAKDRTGLVGARTIYHFIEDSIDSQEDDKKLRKKLKVKFALEIFDEKALAAQIICQNTGEKVLKCSPFELPGLSDGAVGVFRRIGYAGKQAKVFVLPAHEPKD